MSWVALINNSLSITPLFPTASKALPNHVDRRLIVLVSVRFTGLLSDTRLSPGAGICTDRRFDRLGGFASPNNKLCLSTSISCHERPRMVETFLEH